MSDYNYLDKTGLTTLWSKIKSYILSLGYTTNKGTVGGSGTSGYLAKWTGTTAVGNGPQLGNSTVTFLRNDGNWAEPPGTITKIQRNGSDLTISNKTVNINVPTSASQLANDEKYVSAKQSEDNAPYIYRATGGSLKVGNRKNVEAIVGGTVAWNQLANPSSISATATVNNVTFTNNGDGSVTVSGMASAITYFNIVGEKTWTAHKYLLRGCPSGGSLTTYSLMFRGQASPVIDMGNGVLWDASTYRYKAVQICVNQNAAISTPITFKPQVFDLTAMFGTAIADYAYSLEQATAGSGIAWLKSYGFFTEDYYAYDAGSLQSVEATSHVTVGKNAFDIDRTLDVPSPSDLLASPRVMSTDKFYVGLRADNYYYRNYIANYSVSDGVIKVTTGTNNSYGLGFPVKCEPDTQYTLSCDKNNANMSVGCYDADWNYISRLVSLTSDESATFTTPSNAEYITLIFSSLILMEEGTITNIQLECGSSATTYEPYVKHTYPLDSDLVLRGIPKLNNGNLYYDGDTYEWDGTVTRKYAEVDLGTLTWYYNSANAYFYAKLTEAKGVPNARTAANMICDKYINHEWTGLSDKQISRFYASQDGINVKDSSYTDAATFKTAMSGHYLVFELADAYQTTESADPFVELQVVDPDGTEEYIDYGVAQGTRDYAVPVGHKTRYFTVPEIFQYLQNPEYLLTNQIKPMQSKTFTNVIGTVNDWANTTFFFGKIQPTNYYANWHIKYNIYAEAAGRDDAKTTCEVGIYGNQSTYSSYYSWNQIQNESYRPIYYHVFYRATQAGITSNYGHALGIRLQSSWNPITAANSRTIKVDIIECENCTFTFFDNMTLYANIPGTGSTNYGGYSEFDAASNGLQETSDANTITQNRVGYSSIKAAENIYRYQILLSSKDRKTVIPVSNANNSWNIGKTYSTLPFDPFGQIYWYSTTTTVATNGNVPNDTLYRQYMPDFRYAFDLNATATYKLTARQPFYLTATPQFDGTAVLTKPTGSVIGPLSVNLPSSEDGLIYIYMGRAYEDTYPYRGQLSLQHPVYWYKDGGVRLFTADDAYGYSKNYWHYNSTNDTIELIFPS